MASIGETTAAAVAWKRSISQAGSAAAGQMMLEDREFSPNPGALRMLVHRPSGLTGPAPLVVVLHGCTQAAEPHAASAGWLQLANRLGFVVLAPEQAAANNANRCFNWFDAGDQQRGAGEPASIRAMIARLVDTGVAASGQVFVTGLSAGGAMAAVMLATYPEVFAAGAVIAGLPFGAANSVQTAWGAMGGRANLDAATLAARVRSAASTGGAIPRLSVWHGAADHTVNVVNGKAAAAQWALAHGLAETPDSVQALAGRSRSQWRAGDGAVAVELHLLEGFGHGVPLSTRGPGAIGFAAPYMLEAGVASSLEIARFWGLAPEGEESPQVAPTSDAEPTAGAVSDRVLAAIARHVPADVHRVIADALKRAGL